MVIQDILAIVFVVFYVLCIAIPVYVSVPQVREGVLKKRQAKRKKAQKIVIYPPDTQPLPEARVVKSGGRDKRSHNIVE